MTLQFNRAVELRVYAFIRVFTIRDLHFEFSVDLNRDATPNIARIKIYNLSEKTRSYISEEHQGVELYAGYNPDEIPAVSLFSPFPLIFKGSTIAVSSYREGVNWVTEIVAGDGNQEFLESTFQKSYKKGTAVSLIISEVCASVGVPFTSDFIDASAILTRGRVVNGKVKDILDKLADSYYLTWSYQDQVLEVVNAGSPPLKALNVTVLSPDTGLLDTPVLVDRTSAQSEKKVDKMKTRNKPVRVGVRAKSLLNADIKPSRLFSLISALPVSALGIETLKRKGEIKLPTSTSVYIADKVRHLGSNFANTYETQILGDLYV